VSAKDSILSVQRMMLYQLSYLYKARNDRGLRFGLNGGHNTSTLNEYNEE
jgi:hypothetical protein